jgi:hypothetical protein
MEVQAITASVLTAILTLLAIIAVAKGMEAIATAGSRKKEWMRSLRGH